jgi:glycerol-3-phosphate acyltransferase PlsX
MMENMFRVALDGMGGDFAPANPVKAAVDAVNTDKNIKVMITGDKERLEAEFAKYQYNKEQIEIIPTTEEISCNESPVDAIRRKKDSSMVVALRLVRNGEADAFVSSGSSGAVLVGGQVLVGKIKGIERAPLAPLIPTTKGVSLLIDCGANVDAKAHHLVQFARIGTIYMKTIVGIENPKVAIVNIGSEEAKGNALVKETYPLLKECEDVNFIGSIEANEIHTGKADVIVCEAFVGNVILKHTEGLAKTLIGEIKKGMLSSLRAKIGALLVKPALKETLKQFDASQYGGAPLLGLKGLVVKAHGSASAVEIKNAIFQCVEFGRQQVNEKIKEQLFPPVKEEASDDK